MNICACSLNSVQCPRVNHIQGRTRVLFVEDMRCILETSQTYLPSYMVLNTQIFLQIIYGMYTDMLYLEVADDKLSSRSCPRASLLRKNDGVSLSKVSAAEQRARCVLVIQPGCTSDQVVNEKCEESSLKMLKILVFWIFYSALQQCGQ